jgi:hypothetical protein
MKPRADSTVDEEAEPLLERTHAPAQWGVGWRASAICHRIHAEALEQEQRAPHMEITGHDPDLLAELPPHQEIAHKGGVLPRVERAILEEDGLLGDSEPE